LEVPFDVVVTAERAGFYKPAPRPYQLALEELRVPADRALFVAGSPNDLPGASGVGMHVFWHNRLGLPLPGLSTGGLHVGTADRLSPLPAFVSGVHDSSLPTS